MNKWLKILPVAALTLAACDTVIVDSYPSIPVGYYEGDFEAAAGTGNVAAIVVGNPFSGNSASFGDNVRALMKNQVGGSPVSFSRSTGSTNAKAYYVVVVFNPGRGIDNNTMCQKGNQTPTTSGGSGQLSVAMVLCAGDSAKTGTSGRVSGVTSPGDSKFRALVTQVAQTLIPSTDEFRLNRSNER